MQIPGTRYDWFPGREATIDASLGCKSQVRDRQPHPNHKVATRRQENRPSDVTHHGILLHVVFSTKYRKPHLAEAWRDDLFAYIGGIVKDHKSTLLKAGGIEDHIHLLLRIHPEFAISKTVQLMKANSSKWINDQRKTGRKFQWQTGYGAFSVSQSMSETVKNYIGSQREHHRKRTFETEYLSLLEKHGIEYDPTFVFETEIIG